MEGGEELGETLGLGKDIELRSTHKRGEEALLRRGQEPGTHPPLAAVALILPQIGGGNDELCERPFALEPMGGQRAVELSAHLVQEPAKGV